MDGAAIDNDQTVLQTLSAGLTHHRVGNGDILDGGHCCVISGTFATNRPMICSLQSVIRARPRMLPGDLVSLQSPKLYVTLTYIPSYDIPLSLT